MTAEPSVPFSAMLEENLASASPDVLRAMVALFAQQMMGAEADALCGAEYGQAGEGRVNYRNGYRHRAWDTRAGTVDLAVPKLRQGSYFPEWLLERRSRSEQALVSVVATCYLLGVSTRRVERLAQSLGVTQLSKSQVSEMAKTLDARVAEFRNRPLDGSPYTFVWVDALMVKVREGGRVLNVACLVAVGVNADGRREILGIDVSGSENGAGWVAFLRSLVARGLSGVQVVVSDAHSGLVDAIGAVLPGAAWQRCRTHYARNLMNRVPKSAAPWVATLLRTVFEQPDRASVLAQMAQVIAALDERFPQGRRAPGGRPRGPSRLRRLPAGGVAADLVQQPAGAAEQGDSQAHRRGRHLPRPRCGRAPGRRRAGRAVRRVDRVPPLHGRRSPRSLPRRRRTRPHDRGKSGHADQPDHPRRINYRPRINRWPYTTPADTTVNSEAELNCLMGTFTNSDRRTGCLGIPASVINPATGRVRETSDLAAIQISECGCPFRLVRSRSARDGVLGYVLCRAGPPQTPAVDKAA